MQTSEAILMQLAMLPPRARAAVLSKIEDPDQRAAVERKLDAMPQPQAMTLGDARRIAAASPGSITIHRRPKTGSIQCWGKCGRTISANKALCLACQELQDAGLLGAETDPPPTGRGGVKPDAAEGENSPPHPLA